MLHFEFEFLIKRSSYLVLFEIAIIFFALHIKIVQKVICARTFRLEANRRT